MPRTKKVKPKGEYRNLELDDKGRYYFEVKLKSGAWQKFTNISSDNPADAELIAQNTADRWIGYA